MIASLPMYLRPETMTATEALWSLARDALRDHGLQAPDALDHGAPIHATWGRPDLVLGQICVLPFRAEFVGRVTLIGAGDYGLPDAGPGQYYSVFVVRAADPRAVPGDFATARLAVNEAGSQSGWASAFEFAQAHGFRFTRAILTGGHRASTLAVAEGRADIAAVDAVTWALIERHDAHAHARDLRIIGRSAALPGLSFITAGSRDPAPYRAALGAAITALPAAHADTLMLRAVVPLPEAAYTALPQPDPPPIEADAAKTG